MGFVEKCEYHYIYPLITAFPCRHSTILESYPHHLLGVKPVWDFLHPGGSRALLHRRVYRLLHHHPPLPLLPYLSKHPRLPAQPESAHMVPHVLLLRVQCERTCAQPVPLALQQTCLHEIYDRIEFQSADAAMNTDSYIKAWRRNFYLKCCFLSWCGSFFPSFL